jgi:DNA-binding response OmpR family regulator
MKILTLSSDTEINSIIDTFSKEGEHQTIAYGKGKRPIDFVNLVYEKNPSLVIVDDDYVKPDSAVLISTLKKMRKNIKIIFMTSDNSIELGKMIGPLGINYYGIKPIDEKEFDELLHSVSKNKLKSTY